MIAAIYARKSTDQNVSDEEKSVTRQVEHATAYAEKKGWTVAEDHIYVDDGISGAEFVKRPGFLRLMNALKPRPPFQVLIMSEESRLGRESIETGWTLKQIIEAGVRVFYYLEDRERVLDNALDKVMMHLTTFAAEIEREKARQRTRDALLRKASKGYVAGGKVYGYVNERMNDHVELRIHPEQAEAVRRIFRRIADGKGFLRVAKGLTADGVPSPRGNGWSASAVREMVFRDLYRGRLVWGRTRWVDKGGTKKKRDTPESEWVTVEAPELRIVPADLWQAAHERLSRTRQAYLRLNGGKLWGRPERGIEAKYLLTGFLVCGVCGGSFNVVKRTSQQGAPQVYYFCRTHRDRGGEVCPNQLTVPMADLHAQVLGALQRDVLTPEMVERAVRRSLELHAASPDAEAARRDALLAELRKVEGELARLTAAVAQGEPLPSLLEAIRAREGRRRDLQAHLEHLDGLTKVARTWDAAAMADKLRALFHDWTKLLGQEPALGRQVLKKLLVGRLVLTPKVEGRERLYEFSGQASYGRLLAGLVGVHINRSINIAHVSVVLLQYRA